MNFLYNVIVYHVGHLPRIIFQVSNGLIQVLSTQNVSSHFGKEYNHKCLQMK